MAKTRENASPRTDNKFRINGIMDESRISTWHPTHRSSCNPDSWNLKLMEIEIKDKRKFFFEQYGLNQSDLEKYLAAALGAGGEDADLYFEYLTSTSLTVDESLVKSASQGISAGCGVRVIAGERTGYAYTDDLSANRILHAARTAALIASGPAKTPVAGFQEKAARSLYPVTLPSVDAEITAKVELVMRSDAAARAHDPRIKEVRANYSDELRNIQ